MLQASSEGLGRILDAVGTVSVIVGLVQQHHVKVIQLRVEASGAEAAACNAGLTGLTKSVEDRVLASLQAGLTAFFAQVAAMHHKVCGHLQSSLSDAHLPWLLLTIQLLPVYSLCIDCFI